MKYQYLQKTLSSYGAMTFLVFVIFLSYFSFNKQSGNILPKYINQQHLTGKKIPSHFIRETISNKKNKRLIFIFNKWDCEDCILTYLRLIKDIISQNNELSPESISVVGIGNELAYKLNRYKLLYKLERCHFITVTSEQYEQIFAELLTPLLLCLDVNNVIIDAWIAEVDYLGYSKEKIEYYLTK